MTLKRANCDCGHSYDTALFASQGKWNYCPNCGRALNWNAYTNVAARIGGVSLVKSEETSMKAPRMQTAPKQSWPRHHDNLPPTP
jgi:hypothetical protein